MLGRYDRAMRARQVQGGQTLLARAIAAIRRNNGALFYVPANFAGSWTDSAGTDPVDAIGDVIGRMTDRTGGSAVATQTTTANMPFVGAVATRLGPELTTNGGFNSSTGWVNASTGTGSGAISGGVATTTGVDTSNRGKWVLLPELGGIVPGRRYEVSIRVVSGTANSQVIIVGALAGVIDIFPVSGAQTIRRVITASGTTIGFSFNTYGAGTVTWDAFSVREVLEWSYAMSFDGSNDRLTTNITTGNEGWICAGVTHTDALGVSAMTIAYSGYGAGTGGGVILQRNGAGSLLSVGIGNNTATQIVSATSASHGTPYVASGGWDSSILFVGVNNSESSISKTLNCATVNTLTIGTSGTLNFFAGPMTAQVICPVLPSAADRAIIRKWIGSLQGQSL